MGNYTSLGFYKPDASEFVDVDAQLNANWNLADTALRRLVDYEYTTAQFPDGSISPTARSKYYREASNSVVQYVKSTASWNQDLTANVNGWIHASGFLSEGYFESDNQPIYYRKVQKAGSSTAEVEWMGAIWELGGAMELNLNVTPMASGSIPVGYRPALNKYIDVWAGNTSTDFSIARILIGTDGALQFKRYGVNPSGGTSVENRIELTGIKYNVEVTGT